MVLEQVQGNEQGKGGHEFAAELRGKFPIFQQEDIVYLDTAASAQKPQVVLDAMNRFYQKSYANIHRGVYRFSEQATAEYEGAREKVRNFLNARESSEIIFTRGATESINLVAYSWGLSVLQPGDEILVSPLEHHANIVPWQMIATRVGAHIRWMSLDSEGRIDLQTYYRELNSRTRMVAITQLSNGIGVAPPVREMIHAAHQVGALVLLDGAQGICHFRTDVLELDCDFYVFSGHKLYGPTGIGVLYAREEILKSLPPFMGGGDMILSVSKSGVQFQDPPARFEAGTPNIAGAIGLAAAIDFFLAANPERIFAEESGLVKRLAQGLSSLRGVTVHGPKGEHHGLVAFSSQDVHPHDMAQYLSGLNIAVRAGHHCAQPLFQELGLHATTRASLGVYSTGTDIERLLEGVEKAIAFFA